MDARTAHRFAAARLMDRYLLDFSALGDGGHTRNEEMLHAHLFTLANALGVADPVGVRPERRFCRAMVVLSDSATLGDINANLPRFVWQETGQAMSLGSGDALSATPHRLVRVQVLERLDARHPGDVNVAPPRLLTQRESHAIHLVHARADQTLGMWTLGESVPSLDRGFVVRQHSPGNLALPDAAGWRARLYERTQVVLSEVVLGDVNSRTPRPAIYRTRPIARLGDLTLGEATEIEWRPLTEMQICISGFTEASPYVFDDAHPSLRRLLTRSADGDATSQVSPARVPVLSTRAAWFGQTWTGVRWPTSTWTDTRELIAATHQTLN